MADNLLCLVVVEHLLNLLWLALAVSGYLWICLDTRRRSQKHTLFTCVVAVTVLAFLLFPVISMTDDLQIAQNLTQEVPGCSARRHTELVLNGTLATALAADLLQSVGLLVKPSSSQFKNSFDSQLLPSMADWKTSVRGVRPPPYAVA